jgi:NADH-quinone oxidoreductase subunit E
MTVRRLADEAVQPTSFAFSGDNKQWAESTIARFPQGRQQSAVIPLLMRAQDQEGWVSRAAIETIARMLDMAYIRVLEVATFYTQFQLKPVGTNAHILVCGTTPCMLRGAEALRDVCQHRIHPEPFHTNADGTMSWEEVECLGACVNAPMVMIGHDTYEDLTVERFEEIVEAFAAGRGSSIQPGPQIERQFSAAEGGATTLHEPPTTERTYKAAPPPEVPPAPAPAASSTKPTKPGRKDGEVPEEVAPALKGPKRAPKVSQAKAEAARKDFDARAGANGEPDKAMRPDAVGAESPAGKTDAGRAAGKRHQSVPADGTGPADGPAEDAPAKPQEGGVSHTTDAGGPTPKKPRGNK